jgi:hypothetical protein
VPVELSTGPLRLEQTVQVASVGHRLAIGVQWMDALTQSNVAAAWSSELDTIGDRPCPRRFESHPLCRHALRAAGLIARLLAIAAKEKALNPPATAADDPTNFVLRAYGYISQRILAYATSNDPRVYVPRRLSLTPVLANGFPTDTAANVRTIWLWPGSSYPFPSNATGLRGCVRRGPSPTAAKAVAWARIVVTRPGAGQPNFNNETKIGFAHGDDRGEFLVILGSAAVPGGAALPASLALRVWVFLPPADVFEADDPLASLPLEVAGTDAISDVTRGTAPPATYVRQAAIDVPALAPGTVFAMPQSELVFV